jgi:hypothetical protein
VNTKPGEYYGRVTKDGPLLPAPAGQPDVVICRRLADYPRGRPPGAWLTVCARCGAPIAFDPRSLHSDRPHVCMQCCHIRPLPFDDDHAE